MNSKLLSSNKPLTRIEGQVLTRHASYRQGQLVLQYYVKTHSGPVLVELHNEELVCFCRQIDIDKLMPFLTQARVVSLAMSNFQHQSVCGIYLKTSAALKQLQRVANDIGIALYETDIRAEQRYLIERFIAFDIQCEGIWAESSTNLLRLDASRARRSIPAELLNHNQAVVTDALEQDFNLKVISLDLECSMQGELYSVGLYGASYKRVIMIGAADDYPNAEDYIIWVADERALLHALIAWFVAFDPDIIIGWAVIVFDLALLFKRCQYHHIPLLIGRGETALSWKVEDKYRPETLNLPGRVVLDGIDWLKAAFYKFDSFSLEFVSRALLNEGKTIEHVENRGGEISDMFVTDKPKLAHYNLTDCRLVWDIFEKTQLLPFAIERAKLTGLEFGRVGASIAAFYHLYLPYLHRSGFVAPQMPASNGLESPGGYVMDSIPGHYKNVLVLDFKSLYPSIIRTFLIDPKGLVEGLKIAESDVDSDAIVAGFLGAKFHRNNPILPKLIASLAEQRELAKKSHNQPLSQAIKIIMNSLYGVLGSKGCIFHDAKLASSITMRGHQIMKLTKSWVEETGYQVIYGDTDSTFVWLGDELQTSADVIGRQMAEAITQKWAVWCDTEYNLTSFLELEFESHFNQFIMPTLRGSELGSKKRYVGLKIDKHHQPEMVFKGMEQVRSDWTPLSKRIQYQLYQRFFNQQDVSEFLQSQVALLKQGAFDAELVLKKRLKRNVEDYTAKSTPHVKAAKLMAEYQQDNNWLKRGAVIEYVMTTAGVQPVCDKIWSLDYDYYIEKQIKPIAEPILSLLGLSYDDFCNGQMLLI
ncbi:DNA polymerase II [Shewanella holmiensis]|uniref:DNA polymerase n=1 Tax=Shewanella holmiensis TaxID=2952222 RepID=A0A9X3AWB9_9GAMM|nr:DNA polymerase II [Shewanella holmiensis]MCT7943565.1 DNA polymerase II [Shewanella holmiensis]